MYSSGRLTGSISSRPREVGRLPEELLVPPVAEPADTLGEEKPGREAVRQQPDVGAGALRDDPADDAAGRDPAPDPEPTAPDRERSPPLVGNLAPARREVVETRADDARGDAPDRAAEDEIPVAAAVDPPLARDVRREHDRREQGQPVHVDGQRAEVERARGRRGDRREGAHGRRISSHKLPAGCSTTSTARSPFARSSASADSDFSSPSCPMAARTSGVLANCTSR